MKDRPVKEAQARQTFILMSPRKIRRVVNVIRNKSAIEALNLLYLMPYDAARIVRKKLIEAVYNAQQKFGISPAQLVVHRAFADEGPSYRRFKPRAQGRIYRREKPTAHLTVCVKIQEPTAAVSAKAEPAKKPAVAKKTKKAKGD